MYKFAIIHLNILILRNDRKNIMSESKRRWYDRDPELKEAMELLCLSTEDKKDQAAQFILSLQKQVAADVIERIYETISQYHGTGNRWYDNDPIMMKAMEMLRTAKPDVQRVAAKKLLKALSEGSFEEFNDVEKSE